MKNTKNLFTPLLFASLVTGAVLAVLRVFIMNKYYNTEEKLYSAGTELPGVFFTIFVLAFLIIGLSAFLIKQNSKNSVLPAANLPVTFSGAFCGFLFISATVLQIVYFAKSIYSDGNATSYKVLFTVMTLFGLLSALYFFKISSTSNLRFFSVQATCFFPIFWALFYLVFMYFDQSVVMNNPERELVQLAAIASLLYFTTEARYQLGIAKPRLYFAFSLAAIIIIFASSIPNVVLTASGTIQFNSHTIYSFCQIGILSYIITRNFSFITDSHRNA